jgi:hypothetical protein
VKTISQKNLLEDIVVDSSIQHPFGIQFKYCTFIKEEEEEEEVKPNLSTMMQGKLHMVLDQKSNRKSERRRRTEEVDS